MIKYFAIFCWLLATFLAGPVNAAKLVGDIAPPEGFSRVQLTSDSYGSYLRSIALKAINKVKLWNGRYLAEDAYSVLAVLDLPLLFEEDLEQCADFSMRLWAEYLNSVNELGSLSLYDFYGRKRSFSGSGKSLKSYLHWHMTYSNSYSIKHGATKVASLQDMRAGDMYVQNDSEEGIGHVSVVIDEAINDFGMKVYLVGYSFMPAQEFHIEKAESDYGIDGWFTANGYKDYAMSFFGGFGQPVVMRFEKLP